jgi:uncharacterized protein
MAIMDISGLAVIITQLRPALEHKGVQHLAVFGSRARGHSGPDSDLDILLEIEAGRSFSLFDLVEVEGLLANKTGLTANAFMRRSLSPAFATSIAPDIREIF